MSMWTISQMAADYNVSLRTLRFYEERGLLKPTREGVHRYYSARDRVRLELILKGCAFGFTLGEIKTILDGGLKHQGGEVPASMFLTDLLTPSSIMRQINELNVRLARVKEALTDLEQQTQSSGRDAQVC